MIAYKYILSAIEHITVSIVFGIEKYSIGHLTIEGLISFSEHDTLAREYLLAIPHFAPNLIANPIAELWQNELIR